MYQELRSLDTDTAKLTASCCDTCRGLVLRALASLEADLMPCVKDLSRWNNMRSMTMALGPAKIIASLHGSRPFRLVKVKASCHFQFFPNPTQGRTLCREALSSPGILHVTSLLTQHLVDCVQTVAVNYSHFRISSKRIWSRFDCRKHM
jgi:hypothetical protein